MEAKMNENELKHCWELVWQRRSELRDVWPTPTISDSLRFAFTEAGEAMDAYLRMNAEYARNNDKDLSVLDELADCAIMLLTALRDGGGTLRRTALGSDTDIEKLTWICGSVANAMCAHQTNTNPMVGLWQLNCEKILGQIANYPEINLYDRIAARLDRIEEKQRGDRDEYLHGGEESP